MTKTKTTHALTAQAIREELKEKIPGVKAQVRSEAFSMGNAVRVKISEFTEYGPDETLTKARDICAKYQYGHFDGMTDSYEFSNGRNDVPQVKFVVVEPLDY